MSKAILLNTGWTFTKEGNDEPVTLPPVSYTHLDVYKRQILDGITDPLLAFVYDRVNTKFGKLRILMVAGFLIEALALYLSLIHILYALLSNYPGASYIANANTEELAETLTLF